MATIEITKENFKEKVYQPGLVILDWWASWCGPCRAFAPVFEFASAQHPDVLFGKIDTDAQPALSSAFRIRSIPTLMIFKDGVVVFEKAGALSAPALHEAIETARTAQIDDG